MLKEENNLSDHFDWDFLYQNKDFFNQFFSLNYSFTENELLEFKGKLVMGNRLEYFDGSYVNPNYGLIYNQKIRWTNNLIINYLSSLLKVTDFLLPFSGHYEIQFIDLPFDSRDVIDQVRGLNQSLIINGYSYSEEEGYYDSLDEKLKDNDLYYHDMLNQKEFSSSDLIDYIMNSDNYKYYLSNNSFCGQVMNKISTDMRDFNIRTFYSGVEQL
jgi:hypothetical protein